MERQCPSVTVGSCYWLGSHKMGVPRVTMSFNSHPQIWSFLRLETIFVGDYIPIWGFLDMGDPQVTIGFEFQY